MVGIVFPMLEDANERYWNDRLNELDREWYTHWAQPDREWETRSARLRQLQGDLDRLDQEWAVRRESFVVIRNGQETVPSLRGSAAEGVAFTIAGILFVGCIPFKALSSLSSLVGYLVGYLVGLVCIGAVTLAAACEYGNALRHQRAKATMTVERSVLLVQIEDAKRRLWAPQLRRE